MAKDDLILMAEQGRMIGLLLLLYYYFQCLLKFCREEEASGSVVHVHSNKGISVLGRFLQMLVSISKGPLILLCQIISVKCPTNFEFGATFCIVVYALNWFWFVFDLV